MKDGMRTTMMINITESRDDSDNNTSEVVREFINRGMVFTRADLLLWMHTQWGEPQWHLSYVYVGEDIGRMSRRRR